ncbi:MAG: hypothetical protein GY953_32430, partial [bacterium]|nr:hypothetical protein [bacterium]
MTISILILVAATATPDATVRSDYVNAGGTWSISGALGVDSMVASEARWAGEHRAGVRLDAQRMGFDFIGRWSLWAALSALPGEAQSVSLDVVEGNLGLALQFPSRGFLGVIYPYAKAGVS